MFRLVNAIAKPITPELALQFRDMKASPTERDLDPKRVQHLREKVLAGNSVTYLWATAKLGHETLRMNGNHSSNMLCGLDGQFPSGLHAHIDEYECDTIDDLAILFRQFDDRKSGRTTNDVAGAYQGLFDRLSDVPKRVAKLGIEGINWYLKSIEGLPGRTGDDIYILLQDPRYDAFLHFLGGLFSIKTPELKKLPIVAAIYGTFEANPKEAKTFWDAVARGGVEYEDAAPATVLDGWLKRMAENGKDADLQPAHYYQACIYAWNAFRDDRTLTAIKADTKKGMLAISH